MSSLQRSKVFQRSLALLVIVSLLFSLPPAPAIASTPATAQALQQQEGEPVPDPVEPPQWPEVGLRAQYAPSTESLAVPGTLSPAPVAEMAQTPAAAEAPIVPELALPAEPLEVVVGGGLQAAQVGTLPLALGAADAGTGTPLLARVEMLDAEWAQEVSPLGFAFALQLHAAPAAAASAAGDPVVQASQALTVAIDYSRIPLAQASDVAGRLALYRASGCTVASGAMETATPPAAEDANPAAVPLAPAGIVCAEWQQLPATNDFAAQVLLAQLPATPVTSVASPAQEQATLEQTPSEPAVAEHVFLPLISPSSGAASAQIASSQAATQVYLPSVLNTWTGAATDNALLGDISNVIYVLGSTATGPDTDYTATPLGVVDDYQADLYSGAFVTSYDIPVPPAASGAAPSLRLVYNSGGVDAMTPEKNNQPSQIGLGWELDTGSITRLLKPCGDSGICNTGNNYVLSLNGVTSRLISEGGNRYRLQHDPLWLVESYTSTLPAHPDLDKRFWQITTPDGTKYRFGGEFEPETGADQDSAFFVPIRTSTNPLDKKPGVWRWNLDRIEDVNGNVISYFYDQEIHYYYIPADYSFPAYVRSGNVSRIEYMKRAGQITQPQARVLFNMEIRCEDPTHPTWCSNVGAYRDAPADLSCVTYGENGCRRWVPAFWSERRLDSIQTQVYDQTTARWRTAGFYDLRHEFPGFIPRKLWLSGIQQRAGGNYQLSAFTQLEPEKLDAAANVTATNMVLNTTDWGAGGYAYSGGVDSYFVLRDVDFGSGAASLLLRYQQPANGALMEFHLDSPTGPQVAALTRSVSVMDFYDWLTISTPVTGASGVHDLYVVFKQAGVSLNWLRFLPTAALPGLPEATYSYTMLNHRVAVSGVSQFSLPRLSQIATELGGVVQVTYGQSHPCPIGRISTTVHLAYDCFSAFDPENNVYPDSGGETDFALWHKWKVVKLEKWDGFSLNPSEVYTYTYGAPAWHYSDNPLLDEQYSYHCSHDPCNVRAWNEFRGHELVTVTDSSGAKSEYRFYRGMDGDRATVTGGVYAVAITLSDGSTRVDSNWLAGQLAEVRRLKADGSPLARTVYWYTSTLTAGSGVGGAYFTALQREEVTSYGSGEGAAGTHTTATSYEYDAYGNVTRQVLHGDLGTPADDRNVETAYAYNAAAYIVDKPQWQKLWAGTTGGAMGQEQAFSAFLYDGATAVGTPPLKGNLTGTQSYWQASPSYEYVTSSVAYDEYGRPLQVTDGRGNSTATSYHPFYGYAERVTNALGHVTTSVVDPAFGVATQTTDANGRVTTLQYDEYGRLTAVWLPSEPTSGLPSYSFAYDPSSRPARVLSRQLQDASSGVFLESWQFVNGFGRTVQTQTPSAASGSRIVTSRQYDSLGQLLHQSAAYELAGTAGGDYLPPDWATVAGYHRFGYDELGNLWLDETKSQGSVLWSVVTIHDGFQKRQYDPNGRRTDYDSDAFGNLGRVVEYNTGGAVYSTSYSYSLSGSLVQVTDAAGNVTSMGYDLLGRKTSMDDPDMGQWQYRYDAAGNLIAQQDGRGLWLHLGYDALNRLVSKRQDDPVSGSLLAEYVYDAPGQLGLLSKSRAWSSAGVVEAQAVTYDSRDQVTQQKWLVPGADGGTFRTAASYNAAGQKSSFTYPGGRASQLGEVVSYRYDAVGQLAGVSGVVSGETVQYLAAATYNSQGQPLELVNDTGTNGLTRQYVYESNTGRLSVVKAGKTSPFTGLQELTYRYDNNGNVTSLTDGRNAGQVQCFRYDWLDRLTGAFTGDAACSVYSAVGVGAYNHSYSYDAVGNLTRYAGNDYSYGAANDQPHAVRTAFGNSYGYDGSGNQTSRTIAGIEYTLAYDYENRLVEVKQGETVIASFLYDADGNRVKGIVAGVSTVYIGGVYEQTGSSTIRYYAEAGAMRRAGFAGSNGAFYLLQDQVKSTSVIATRAGVVAARQYYYPYGGNRGGAAYSSLTSKRFTGQYHEASLPGAEGLSYYNARWYDPQLGRFVSPDTVVPNPANPQDLNRYTYAGNNPILYNDPSGHCLWCVFVAGVAAFLMGSSSGDVTRAGEAPKRVVEQYAGDIKSAARAFRIDPVILGAVIDHESGNMDRFGGWGDSTYIFLEGQGYKRPVWSYGLGQIQLPAAKRVEDAGLMPKLANDDERRNALMDNVTNIHYTAAKLSNDRAQIQAWYQGRGMPIDEVTLNRLMMLSYNQGWDDPNSSADVLDNLEEYGPTAADLLIVTQSLAYDGMIGNVKINDYHTSLMWNSARISYVEKALNVDCSVTTR